MNTFTLKTDEADSVEEMFAEAVHAYASQPGVSEHDIRTTRAILKRNISYLLRSITHHIDAIKNTEALLMKDDASLFFETIEKTADPLPKLSKVSKLQLLGRIKFLELLEEAGGTYNQTETANYLGITPDAVRKRYRKSKLLGVKVGDHVVYPVFQFYDGGILSGLGTYIHIMSKPTPLPHKDMVSFFISEDSELKKKPYETIIEHENLELVAKKAAQFMRQGAT